ncbi:MAG: chromate transporter [Candidatus Fimenecus sp.]
MIYLQLFFSFLQVGLFSVGGGYAAIPLIQSQAVDKYGWLSLSEFTNLVTVAEMTPGPIAVNAATFTGIQIAGIGGAVVATFGCISPSMVLVSVLAVLYGKFKKNSTFQNILQTLRPAVVALILSAGLHILRLVAFGEQDIALDTTNLIGILLFAGAFFVLRKWKISPILVLLLCGGLNLGIYAIGTLF